MAAPHQHQLQSNITTSIQHPIILAIHVAPIHKQTGPRLCHFHQPWILSSAKHVAPDSRFSSAALFSSS